MDIVHDQRAVLPHREGLPLVQLRLHPGPKLVVDGGLRIQDAVLAHGEDVQQRVEVHGVNKAQTDLLPRLHRPAAVFRTAVGVPNDQIPASLGGSEKGRCNNSSYYCSGPDGSFATQSSDASPKVRQWGPR